MRTFDRTLGIVLVGLGLGTLGLTPALGFDGPTNGRPALQSLPSPAAPFGSANPALVPGDRAKAINSLEYAAEKGVPAAQWQLGHMYAKGEGVPRSDLRAFGYFGQIANRHAEDGLDSPNARIVANAIVAVGQYYLEGIPDSDVKADPARARRMFFYAATYFGDPEAQYLLGRLFLSGNGGARDAVQAARWLKLAAAKDQHAAQAVLGDMLVRGEFVPRQVARGLMYLILARDAVPDEAWINALYQEGLTKASEDDRTAARIYLQQWVRGLRD
jgi:TPR repeat protein